MPAIAKAAARFKKLDTDNECINHTVAPAFAAQIPDQSRVRRVNRTCTPGRAATSLVIG